MTTGIIIGLAIGFLVGMMAAALCRGSFDRESAAEGIIRQSRKASTWREGQGYRPKWGPVNPVPPQGGSGTVPVKRKAKRKATVKHGS
jgi:hypothetical protein